MNDELFTLIAGSAARPGTPTALWLGSLDSDRCRRQPRRRTLRHIFRPAAHREST
jgi:hypothetical protein